MGQSTDQIRQEIDHNRNDAAQKIDQLQSQIQGTADQMRTSVQDTAEQMVDQVKGTVDDTVASVKQSFDIKKQVEERPLMSLGVALVGGFLLGGMTGGGGGGGHQQRQQYGGYYGGGQHEGGYQSGEPRHSSSQHQSGGVMANGIRSAVQKTGIEDTISNAAAALLGSVTDQLKSTLDQNFPGFADKMNTAQHSSGDFTDKARKAQSSTTTSA